MLLWAILALASAVVFGIKDILVKNLFRKNVSSFQMVFEQNLLLVIIILLVLFPKVDFQSYHNLGGLYLLKALAVACATIFYFELLKRYEISLVSPLLNLSPFVLLILSSIFLSETISIIQFIGIVLILVSTYFLEINKHHYSKAKPYRHHINMRKLAKSNFFVFALITLITISLAAIFDKMILRKVNVYTDLFFTALIILIIMIVYFIKEGYIKKAISDLVYEPETLLIGMFSIISNLLVLFAIAIPTAMVSLIIPLRRTSTLFSSLFGGILFHEKHLKKKLLAILGMLLGVVLIVI